MVNFVPKRLLNILCEEDYQSLNCDPGGIRTHDPQLRRLLLYPTELRDQTCRAAVTARCAKVKVFPEVTKAAAAVERFGPIYRK